MWAFFLLTLAAILLCGLVLWPFLAGIVFAITIAVCTQKPYNWLAARIRNPSLCASIALIILLLVGIIPLIEIVRQLIGQASYVVTTIGSGAGNAQVQHFFEYHPALGARLQKLIDVVDLNSLSLIHI